MSEQVEAPLEWQTLEKKYRIDFTNGTFTKTEIPFFFDKNGTERRPYRLRDRLTNEFRTLQFIRENTTIPVPEPLSLTFENGCLKLTTKYIRGGVPFDYLTPKLRSKVEKLVPTIVEERILSQLRRLESDTTGSLCGFVIPPQRVIDRYPHYRWDPQYLQGERVELRHCDLSKHNLLFHYETGKFLSVIDWEHTGFHPKEFEMPLWRMSREEQEEVDLQEIDCLLHLLGPSRMECSFTSFRKTDD